MAKSELRFANLRVAMANIQTEREQEVGRHTWRDMVERYGEAYLFMEVASVVSRLEELVWHNNPYENPDRPERIERILDLCIDGANFLEFLYMATIEREQKFNSEIGLPTPLNPFDPPQPPKIHNIPNPFTSAPPEESR